MYSKAFFTVRDVLNLSRDLAIIKIIITAGNINEKVARIAPVIP